MDYQQLPQINPKRNAIKLNQCYINTIIIIKANDIKNVIVRPYNTFYKYYNNKLKVNFRQTISIIY